MSVVLLFAVAGGVSLILGVVLTPVAGALARRLGAVAHPSANRWNRRPVPYLGGIAIFAGTVLGALGAVALLENLPFVAGGTAVGHMAVVGVSAAMMFFVGLVDDVVTLRPQLKFILQVVAGLLLVGFGAILPLTPWYTVNALVTLFWFVGITNAFNLLDNMDGVAAGVAAVASFFLGLALARQGAWLGASVAWALMGATLGFLRYNFHPATVFMGDAGSLFVGASLAGLAVSTPSLSGNLVSVMFVPLIILAVPILDTGLVTVTRLLTGRALSQGGRDHTAHRLVTLGLSERRVALLLYAFATVGGLVALALTGLDAGLGFLLGTGFLVALGLAAAYLGRMRVGYSDPPRGSKRITVLVANLLYKRRLAKLLLDVALVVLAYYGAFRLKFDHGVPSEYAELFRATLGAVIFIKVVAFGAFGVYRGAWKYSSILDLYRIIGAVVVSAVAVFLIVQWRVPALPGISSIVLIDALLVSAFVLSSRLSFRSLEALRTRLRLRGEPVLFYGAGDAGDFALREVMNNPSLKMRPACFIDDDRQKHGTQIHGVPVIGGWESLSQATERFKVSKIVIATKKLTPEVRAALRDFALVNGLEIVEMNLDFCRVPDVLTQAEAVGLPKTEARRSSQESIPAVR